MLSDVGFGGFHDLQRFSCVLLFPQELLQGSVLVMETNSLYSIVVLMCTLPGQKETEVLLTLEYGDPTQYIPTRVTFDSEGTLFFLLTLEL